MKHLLIILTLTFTLPAFSQDMAELMKQKEAQYQAQKDSIAFAKKQAGKLNHPNAEFILSLDHMTKQQALSFINKYGVNQEWQTEKNGFFAAKFENLQFRFVVWEDSYRLEQITGDYAALLSIWEKEFGMTKEQDELRAKSDGVKIWFKKMYDQWSIHNL